MHCDNSHNGFEHTNQPEQLAIITDRYTTRYGDWEHTGPPVD